ncbi:MAG: dihydropteroate synthase [Burkholderiales bacterium]|nr:dihydropteroate synthase [Burkholderiales bacterium]
MKAAKLWQCGRFQLNLDRPLIMGVVNVTVDSFSDGGDFLRTTDAIAHGKHMIEEGADIIDIGGQSTRPGAQEVSQEEELSRVLPVIESLKSEGVPISCDTFLPKVMVQAVHHGASIINDIKAFSEKGAVEAISKLDCGLCAMHMQGTPQTMQINPQYSDVVVEVKDFLLKRTKTLEDAGIQQDRICLDPGFGFGKTVSQNFELLAKAQEFVQLGYPILYGMSRKSSLGTVTGINTPKDRLIASVTAHLLAVLQGVQIVRVHDVKATREAFTILEATRHYEEL